MKASRIPEPSAKAISQGAYGLRHAAERQGLSLHTFDVEALAKNTLLHAINSGKLITTARHQEVLNDECTRGDRLARRWAIACNERDRALVRIQAALEHLPDRDLALRLAIDIGVVLPPAKATS